MTDNDIIDLETAKQRRGVAAGNPEAKLVGLGSVTAACPPSGA